MPLHIRIEMRKADASDFFVIFFQHFSKGAWSCVVCDFCACGEMSIRESGDQLQLPGPLYPCRARCLLSKQILHLLQSRGKPESEHCGLRLRRSDFTVKSLRCKFFSREELNNIHIHFIQNIFISTKHR